MSMGNSVQRALAAGSLRKLLLICGFMASLTQVVTDIVGGLLYPGYSFISQAISELTAIDAPTRPLLVPIAPVYSGFQIAFGLGVWLIAGQRRVLRVLAVMQILIGLVAIAWTPFPMHMRGEETTFTDTMHNTFAGVQVLFILTSLVLGTLAYLRTRFGYYSLGTLLVLVALGSLSFLVAGKIVPQEIGNYFGILERITVYGYMLWVTVLAFILLREQRIALKART